MSNLVSLAIKISGLNLEASDAHLSQEQFSEIVTEIFDKITLLGKWERRNGESGEESEDEEECDQEEDEDDTEKEHESGDSSTEDGESDEEDEVLNYYLGQ